MLSALDVVADRSADIVEHPPAIPIEISHTGRPGRPRKDINPQILEASLQLRGVTHLAPVFQCSSRTIRRRALEYGLAESGPPVYITYEDPESGETLRMYRSSTAPMSMLSDNELDSVIAHILSVFPSFGRRMIGGHLEHLGHHVPRDRVGILRSSNWGPCTSDFPPH